MVCILKYRSVLPRNGEYFEVSYCIVVYRQHRQRKKEKKDKGKKGEKKRNIYIYIYIYISVCILKYRIVLSCIHHVF